MSTQQTPFGFPTSSAAFMPHEDKLVMEQAIAKFAEGLFFQYVASHDYTPEGTTGRYQMVPWFYGEEGLRFGLSDWKTPEHGPLRLNIKVELEQLMTLSWLKELLVKSWSEVSAYKGADPLDYKWSKEVPSQGQCLPTALIVQDFFGGDLVRGKSAKGTYHFWNKLPSGEIVDLTEEQFLPFGDSIDHTQGQIVIRWEILDGPPHIGERYFYLKSEVSQRAKAFSTYEMYKEYHNKKQNEQTQAY